ncbi:MAG: ABC transporter ATP-binding protein/permease [Planctomycetia bacterium]|nr:ABC transporter ATP-binding protein/permease [Planctomycetia bacterium]
MNAPRATRSVFLRVLREARPYRWHIAGLLSLGLLAAPLGLLAAVPLKIAVDSVLGSYPLPRALATLLPEGTERVSAVALAAVAGLLVLIAVTVQALNFASALLRTYTGEKLVLAFRARLFRHSQRLSLAYHDTRGAADSAYRIQWDAPCVQWIIVDGLVPLVSAACTLALMFAVVVRLDWQLAIVAAAVCPLLFAITRHFRRRLRERSHEVKERDSSVLSLVQEVLAGLRVVKAFGQEDRESGRFVGRAQDGLRARLRLAVIESAFAALVALTFATGMGAVLFVGVRHVQAGTLTLGELLLIVTYLVQVYAPLETISKKVGDLQASLASAERAFAVLDEEPEVVERADARPLERATGAIEFAGVSFEYTKGRSVLDGISFLVPAGSRVGIAGTTGAGKTTLISLLTRLYDPIAGRIALDGTDLRDIRLADLRNQFAIVLQEPVLFSASISENIAYARPEATTEEIIAAAKAANIHDVIMQLPRGYDTQVGERGMQLSGGERQRVSLARAFLKDAPLLILDEPTSSVDVATESAILEALDRLMRGRTTFIIAHRLGTLEGCDVRLRLERGRLVRESTLQLEPQGAT